MFLNMSAPLAMLIESDAIIISVVISYNIQTICYHTVDNGGLDTADMAGSGYCQS